MRRAQNDIGSQPVQNQCTNPRWEDTGSSVIIRTNWAPNPRMVNTSMGGYGTQTLAAVTGIAGHPEGITTAVRVSYTTGNSGPGAMVISNPDVATQFTITAWVYNEGSVTESIGIAQQSVASGGTQGVPPGVWTKLTWQAYISHATTSYAIGVRIGTAANTGSFLVTGVVAEKSASPLGAFFDGSSAATNDFTHSWAGAVNNSASRQSAISVEGSTINMSGTGNKFMFMCSERPALNGRFIRTVIDTSQSVGINTLDCVVPSGVKRTNLFWLRTSRALAIQIRYRNSSGAAVSNGPIINTNANEWQLWRLIGAPTIADNQHLSLLFPGGNVAPGDVVDLGPHMVVEGEYAGDYVDGTKPFSKWYGTPNESLSVGYPPQLLDIAGAPVLDVSGASNIVFPLSGGFTGAEARTFYTVYQPLALPGAGVHVMVTYGDSDLNDVPNFSTLQLRLQGSSLVQILNRRTGGQGALIPTVPFPFNNVACWGIDNAGLQFAQNNNTALVTSNQVMDVLNEAIRLHASNAYQVHIRTIMYRGFHDATTREAMNRYLANKYGGYVV